MEVGSSSLTTTTCSSAPTGSSALPCSSTCKELKYRDLQKLDEPLINCMRSQYCWLMLSTAQVSLPCNGQIVTNFKSTSLGFLRREPHLKLEMNIHCGSLGHVTPQLMHIKILPG